jgi:hypothetical protein
MVSSFQCFVSSVWGSRKDGEQALGKGESNASPRTNQAQDEEFCNICSDLETGNQKPETVLEPQ